MGLQTGTAYPSEKPAIDCEPLTFGRLRLDFAQDMLAQFPAGLQPPLSANILRASVSPCEIKWFTQRRGDFSLTYGNGAVTNYAFDPASRLQSLAHDLSGTANDQSTTFTYNPASQIASTTRSNDAYAWNGHYNVNRAYATNGLNQLTAAGATARNWHMTARGGFRRWIPRLHLWALTMLAAP